MDIFKTPGNNLMGLEKLQFDEIKTLVDSATVDMLLRPDWETNIRIVDAVNQCSSQATINEVVFLLRRKFTASNPKTVYLALTLIEALVKNCGHRVYIAVNQESFMKELGKVARKYSGKSGAEHVEVATMVLDIIQGWGEAFLPMVHRYPNIPKLYQELRKERLPFNSQYDKNRVPIFTEADLDPNRRPSNPQSASYAADPTEDALIAAAVAASLNDEPGSKPVQTTRRSSSSSVAPVQSQPKNDIVESIITSKSILSEIILAASSAREVANNEICQEVYNQITFLLKRLTLQIESEVVTNPEGLDILFQTNDEGQSIISLVDRLKKGSVTLEQAKQSLTSATSKSSVSSPTKETNLLDLDSPTQKTTTTTKSMPGIGNQKSTRLEETMGLFSISNGDVSPSTVQSLPVKRGSVEAVKIPPRSAPAPVAPTKASVSVDDPFGPSSSSIDALLVEAPAKPERSSSLGLPVTSPPPPPAGILDPFDAPPAKPSMDPFAMSSTPLVPAKSVKAVDPLDDLLAIATRKSDDFGSNSQGFPNSGMAPPRGESSIPMQPSQNFPPPLIPSQAPYPGAGTYPPSQVTPAQPSPWSAGPVYPNQPGAPLPYWQVGGQAPAPGGFPPQAPNPYPPQFQQQQYPAPRPPPNNGASNPFDLI